MLIYILNNNKLNKAKEYAEDYNSSIDNGRNFLLISLRVTLIWLQQEENIFKNSRYNK